MVVTCVPELEPQKVGLGTLHVWDLGFKMATLGRILQEQCLWHAVLYTMLLHSADVS